MGIQAILVSDSRSDLLTKVLGHIPVPIHFIVYIQQKHDLIELTCVDTAPQITYPGGMPNPHTGKHECIQYHRALTVGDRNRWIF
jgi:hypothetical protein